MVCRGALASIKYPCGRIGAKGARDAGCGAGKLISVGLLFIFLPPFLLSFPPPPVLFTALSIYILSFTLTSAKWFGELKFKALAFEILRFEV